MVDHRSEDPLFLYALILLGLIVFGFFLLGVSGLLALALTSDRSMISWAIFALYVMATGHWLWRAWRLEQERRLLAQVEAPEEDGEQVPFPSGCLLEVCLQRLEGKPPERQAALIETLGDELTNTHAAGHFISDLLLKLGLTGTVIGFILMLLPIGNIGEFDPSLMQQLLSAISGGMAVALYTTLAGLVTSTLLKLQYHMLDASLADLVNRVSALTHAQR